MPDTRKRILVEPDTHSEFMKFTVENSKTHDTGLIYLLRQDKLLKKLDSQLYKKIKFTLS